MSNDSLFIQRVKGTPWKFKADKFIKEMNRIWDKSNTIFKKGIEDEGKHKGVHEKYWFKEDFPLMLISMKYGVTIFWYYNCQEQQTLNKNTTMLSDMGTQVFFYQDDRIVQTINTKMARNKERKLRTIFFQSTTLFAFLPAETLCDYHSWTRTIT